MRGIDNNKTLHIASNKDRSLLSSLILMRLKELPYSIASCFVKLFINYHLMTPRFHRLLNRENEYTVKRKQTKDGLLVSLVSTSAIFSHGSRLHSRLNGNIIVFPGKSRSKNKSTRERVDLRSY